MWSTLASGIAINVRLLAALVGVAAMPCSYLHGQTVEPGESPPADVVTAQAATQILHYALHESVWGPAVHCRVRQRMQLYERQISGFGTFVRIGQGTGKLKLSLQFAAGDSINALRQISDGQLLHTIENVNGRGKRTIIDLDKVRNPLVINNETISDPKVSMYLAIGGQAEAIRKLCLQYSWHDVKLGQLGETPVWILEGRLASSPPPICPDTIVDSMLYIQNQSALLPTIVRAMIGKPAPDDRIRYWLYQVEQRRSSDEPSPVGHSADLQLVTEWFEPQLINVQELDEQKLFDAGSSTDPLFEETNRYLPRSPNLVRTASASNNAAPTR